ncbi:MAG: hypothetical protein KGM44_13845 [bacterium]|nr:hypothetical protein [bacterium]
MNASRLGKIGVPFVALTVLAALAACGGGGGGGTTTYGGGTAVNPPATQAPTSSQQVIGMALPQSSIGTVSDPKFGVVGGYTQASFSQVLAFAPGTQVMLRNLAGTTQHTLNVLSTSGFPPPGTAISTSASGGSTLSAGYASGTLNGGQLVGPITLTAGTYYIGCAFHYTTNAMRDVLIVQANATPGPQATAPPSGGGNPCPGNYC